MYYRALYLIIFIKYNIYISTQSISTIKGERIYIVAVMISLRSLFLHFNNKRSFIFPLVFGI